MIISYGETDNPWTSLDCIWGYRAGIMDQSLQYEAALQKSGIHPCKIRNSSMDLGKL